MHSHFVGLDVHKQLIAYCVKSADGSVVREGKIAATRAALDQWAATLPQPWCGAMEATLFSHWIYHHLKPHALRLEMGHPARIKAITAAKKKSDKIDARTLADLLRANLFPACFVISPELGALRRQLRFRRKVVEQMVCWKNHTATLLMESGIEYQRRRLHGKRYFAELLEHSPQIPPSLRPLLAFEREQIETLERMDRRMVQMLERHPRLESRVKALMEIDGVGPITALTWALEIAAPERFMSIKNALSYCGLVSALRESAGRVQRGPLSKQRNRHLQSVLIEAAKMAPLHNQTLREVQARAIQKGAHPNRATVTVARKLTAYLLAADRAFLARQSVPGESAAA